MATKRKTVQSDPLDAPVNPSDEIWREMGRASRKGDDSAARELLAAGIPIYYSDDDTPAEPVMKKHPDGRRQLVRFDPAGDDVIRDPWPAGPGFAGRETSLRYPPTKCTVPRPLTS